MPAPSPAATTLARYFAHEVHEDANGVIAPWHQGQNGQCDERVRRAVARFKNSGWTSLAEGGASPNYFYNGTAEEGMGQRSARAMFAMEEYYRYSGDPWALAQIRVIADTMTADRFLTPETHPWPRFLVTNPAEVAGTPPGSPVRGFIQLDILGEIGTALIHASHLTGDTKYLDLVRHWADVLAEKCNYEPGAMPWPRYVEPDKVPWGTSATGNLQTGGVVYELTMLEELIALGYTGADGAYLKARDAGRAYLQLTLLPKWHVNDTWGRNYWDWEHYVQGQTTTDWAANYLMSHPDEFPQWKSDVRNILGLYLNHASADPGAMGEAYSGAWALPEGCACCGPSLAWAPMELAIPFSRYGVLADDKWAREVGRRMQIIATYDVNDSLNSEDKIMGGETFPSFLIVNLAAIKWVMKTMSWLPETLAPDRDNHLMRSSSVVQRVSYEKGRIQYQLAAAPSPTIDVLRLSFTPDQVEADGVRLNPSHDPTQNCYVVEPLANGDCIVKVRHDGARSVTIRGDDPQQFAMLEEASFTGAWVKTATGDDQNDTRWTNQLGDACTQSFTGNQVRLIGSVGPEGGWANIYIDGERQSGFTDFWNPETLHRQPVFHRGGLTNGPHTIRIVVRAQANPLSKGKKVSLAALQFSDAAGSAGFGQGGGPTEPQRMIFGFTARPDYVDSLGHSWRPGTEFIARTGGGTDTVTGSWWTQRRPAQSGDTSGLPDGTPDPEIYAYGIHWPELTINLTVGPGRYDVRLKFAETQFANPGQRLMNISINDQVVADNVDILARSGRANRAVDLAFPDVQPANGMIEIALKGLIVGGSQCQAMIQALEILPIGDTQRSSVDPALERLR